MSLSMDLRSLSRVQPSRTRRKPEKLKECVVVVKTNLRSNKSSCTRLHPKCFSSSTRKRAHAHGVQSTCDAMCSEPEDRQKTVAFRHLIPKTEEPINDAVQNEETEEDESCHSSEAEVFDYKQFTDAARPSLDTKCEDENPIVSSKSRTKTRKSRIKKRRILNHKHVPVEKNLLWLMKLATRKNEPLHRHKRLLSEEGVRLLNRRDRCVLYRILRTMVKIKRRRHLKKEN